MSLVACAPLVMAAGTPTISNFTDFTYTEQSAATLATGSVTLTNGGNYADSYLQFSISGATSTETLGVVTVGSASTTSGAVSIVGTNIFLGTGSSAKQIGTVDSTYNGAAGSALRLNFASPLDNGGFEFGTTAWTINTYMITLGALNTHGADETGDQGNFSSAIENEGGTRGNVLHLSSTGGHVATPYGSMFGPEAWSSPFTAYAGDSLAVDWKAQGGEDSYEVYGFLYNTNTHVYTELFWGRGASQAWTTATGTIPADGTYQFRFVSGSYDQTGGQALGASLYIDNVRVFGNDGDDSVATKLGRLVTYQNSSKNPSATRTLNLTAIASDGSSASDTATITITLVNDAPTDIALSNNSVNQSGGTNATVGTLSSTDPDSGSFTYTLVSGTGSTDNSYFDISGSTLRVLSGPATPAGSRTIRVRTTDGGGLYYEEAFSITVVDDVPPSPPSCDLDASSDTGNSGTDDLTYDTTPTFTGTAEAGATVRLYTGATLRGTTTAAGDGSWTITSSAVAAGSVSFTATATDGAGNVSSASSAVVVAVDTTVPSPSSIVRRTPSSSVAGSPVTYRLTFSEGVSGVDSADFTFTTNNTVAGTIASITPVSAAIYDIVVSPVTGNGDLRLDLKSSGTGIADLAGNAITTGYSAGESYAIDTVGPVIVGPLAYLAKWGAAGTGNGDFNQPYGVAVDRGGLVWVADTFNHRIQKFAADGSHLLSFGSQGTADGEFKNPYGVATDSVGNVYVTDGNNHRVQKFAADGSHLLTFGTQGAGDGQFYQPRGIAVDSAGAIYVVDSGNHRVQKFNAAGSFVAKWGTLGTADGKFNLPFGIAVDGTGYVYVADTNNNRIEKFDTSGNFVAKWGSVGSTNGKFNLPYGVAVDPSGVYVADTRNNRVQKFDDVGTFLFTVGAHGTGNGDFYYPATLSLAANGYAYVADTLNNRIEIFDPISTLATVPAAGLYRAGQHLDVLVEYNQAVVVTGSPRIALTIGSSTVYASYYAAGSTGALVAFRYTVQPGDTDTDGIAIDTSIGLNGGTIADPAGNAAELTYLTLSTSGVIVDTTPPATPAAPDLLAGSDSGSSSTDNNTSDTTPTFSGTAEAGSTVVLYADAAPVGSTTATGGNWTITSSTLADGAYAMTVIATDPAGNDSAASAALNVTIDTGAPAAPAALKLTAGTDTGSSQTDNITSLTHVSLQGTAEANSTVTVTRTGTGVVGTTTTDGSGNWTFDYTSATLTEGSHSFTATATDAAGNTGTASGTLTVVVDTTAPSAPSTPDLAAGSDSGTSSTDDVTSVASPTFVGTAESGSTVTLYADASSVGSGTATGGNWSIASSSLADGIRLLTARATDVAGNQSAASSSLSVRIDTAAPAAPSTPDLATASDSGASSSDNTTSVTTPTFTGTAEANSVVTLYRAGSTLIGTATADGSGNWSITSSTLADGTHSITAKATDSSGNLGVASSALSVTIDTAAPSAPSTPDLSAGSDSGSSSTDNNTSSTTPTFTGTAEAGSTVTLYADGTAVGTATATGGNWSVTTSALTDGVYSITAKATDASGNLGAASSALSLTIDTTAPSAPAVTTISTDAGSSNTDGITNDTTLVVSGTAEANSVVTVSRSGAGVLGTATADGSGNWSYDYTGTTLTPGSYSFTATATDTAGNTGVASSAFAVTVDTTAPSVSSIVRSVPSASLTNSTSLTYRVTFGEAVAGVSTGSFTLTATGNVSGSISGVASVSDSVYDVTVTSVTGNGDLRLDLKSSGSGVTDTAGTAISGGYTSGESYSIDTVAPALLGPLSYSSQWGSTGTANGEFFHPWGVAVDRAGNVYVADSLNNRIQKFTAAGAYLTSWGSTGTGDGQFQTPMGLAVDANDYVYVTDSDNNRVQKFTSTGTFVSKFGTTGTGNGQFDRPYGIALDSAGMIYVADYGNHRIQKFNAGGAFVLAWGGLGTTNGKLYLPYGVAADLSGNVYVADTNNNRVQKFSNTGTYVTAWGSFGTGDGQFNTPSGIAVDAGGHVYVSDTANHRIEQFDPTGGFASAWGELGAGDGEFYYPAGIAVAANGNVYIADTFNDRIQIFAPTGALADAPADGTYGTGSNLDFTLAYSSAVVVTGTPRIALTVGSSTVYATYYAAGSTGGRLVFRYTVQSGDLDADGVVLASSVSLNGGTIADAAGNAAAITFTVPSLAGVLVEAIPPAAPVISGITGNAISGTAEPGSTVSIYVDGVFVTTIVAAGNGSWSYTLDTTGFSPGGYAITATATDENDNTSTASSATSLYVPAITCDFNSDGKNDILWQNTVNGNRSVWLMNGTTRSSSAALPNVTLDWHIVGSGDFNGDHKPDIVWQNTVNGNRAIWLMNGTTFSSGVALPNMAVTWSIAGTGDFNGDGKADLLWQNTSTGARMIWLMNGTTYDSTVNLPSVTLDWYIAGTGDFNGDGKVDIVWQNLVNGNRSIWLMNGTTFSSGVALPHVTLDWRIAGAADFNGDGRPDLLWQNIVNSNRAVWLMNGTTYGSAVALPAVTSDWSMAY